MHKTKIKLWLVAKTFPGKQKLTSLTYSAISYHHARYWFYWELASLNSISWPWTINERKLMALVVAYLENKSICCNPFSIPIKDFSSTDFKKKKKTQFPLFNNSEPSQSNRKHSSSHVDNLPPKDMQLPLVTSTTPLYHNGNKANRRISSVHCWNSNIKQWRSALTRRRKRCCTKGEGIPTAKTLSGIACWPWFSNGLLVDGISASFIKETHINCVHKTLK